MMKTSVYLLVILEIISVNYAQRVAPGVPPQHYQQQQHVPQHPHMQQQQQQHINQMPIQQQQQQMHQVPIQQQQQMHQVPVQQQTAPQQMHPPVQQVPIQQQQQVPVQAHHGHHGQHNGQILNAANIAHEKEHIAEHMDIPMDTSKMSEQELQFHYFKMHDADNNNKLDGCELIKSLIHWHGTNDDNSIINSQSDDELSEIVDPLLQTMDINLDGYVDYAEFKIEMGIN